MMCFAFLSTTKNVIMLSVAMLSVLVPIYCAGNTSKTLTSGQCSKTYYGHKLQLFIIS
jgi:hypothetical protein